MAREIVIEAQVRERGRMAGLDRNGLTEGLDCALAFALRA